MWQLFIVVFFSQLHETFKTILLVLFQVIPEGSAKCLKSAISIFNRFSFDYILQTL